MQPIWCVRGIRSEATALHLGCMLACVRMQPMVRACCLAVPPRATGKHAVCMLLSATNCRARARAPSRALHLQASDMRRQHLVAVHACKRVGWPPRLAPCMRMWHKHRRTLHVQVPWATRAFQAGTHGRERTMCALSDQPMQLCCGNRCLAGPVPRWPTHVGVSSAARLLAAFRSQGLARCGSVVAGASVAHDGVGTEPGCGRDTCVHVGRGGGGAGRAGARGALQGSGLRLISRLPPSLCWLTLDPHGVAWRAHAAAAARRVRNAVAGHAPHDGIAPLHVAVMAPFLTGTQDCPDSSACGWVGVGVRLLGIRHVVMTFKPR